MKLILNKVDITLFTSILNTNVRFIMKLDYEQNNFFNM